MFFFNYIFHSISIERVLILNKQLPNIIIYDFLLGTVPYFLFLLGDYSVFSIAFTRFLIAGVITLMLAFIGLYVLKKTLPPNTRKEFGLKNIKKYLKEPNRKFSNKPQWFYLCILGMIGISSQILFSFFGLRLAGTALTYTAVPFGIIIIALINWANKKEAMDPIKIAYLFILFIVISIIIYEKTIGIDHISITFFGVICIIIYTISRSFRYLITEKDETSDWEINLIHLTKKKYKLIRSLFKAGFSELYAALSVFIVSGFMYIAPESSIPGIEARYFYSHLYEIIHVMSSGAGIALIILNTVIPFILFFSASAFWPRGALSIEQWASILDILIPLIGITIGVFLLHEPFPSFSLLMIYILVFLSILLRFFHESNNVINVFLMFKVKKPYINKFIMMMLKRTGLIDICSILGDYDAIATMQIPNIHKYGRILNYIKETEYTSEIKEIFMTQVIK